MKNVQKIIFLSLVAALCLSSNIFAQAEKEKEIIIVKKIVDENGVESEEKIVLKGDEAEKYITDQGIKITEKTNKKGDVEMTVEVTAEGDGYEEMNVTISDDGKQKIIKTSENMTFLDSEGEELPEDVKKILLENGIDIDQLLEDHTDGNEKSKKHSIVVVKDKEGKDKIIEWDGKGEMPAEMKELIDEHASGKNAKTITQKIIIEEDVDVDVNKAGETTIIKIKKNKNGELTEEVIELSEGKDENGNYRTEHKVLKIKGGDIVKCSPDELIEKNTESLSKEEIEIVEEQIIEETGQQVEIKSGPNTLEVSTLDLFPNPTDGNIRVRFVVDNIEETNVRIIDIAGRTVYEKNLPDFTGTFDEEIELPRTQLGTLVLIISQGQNVFTEKIILR